MRKTTHWICRIRAALCRAEPEYRRARRRAAYVREAERLMTETAADAPGLLEIAARVGVSARTLSEGFRRFRGFSPHDYMAARG